MAYAGPVFPSNPKDGQEEHGYRYEKDKEQWRFILHLAPEEGLHRVWDAEINDWVDKPVPNRLNKLFDRVAELEQRVQGLENK